MQLINSIYVYYTSRERNTFKMVIETYSQIYFYCESEEVFKSYHAKVSKN